MKIIDKIEIIETKHKNPMSIYSIDVWRNILNFRGFNSKHNQWIHGMYLPYTAKTSLNYNPNDIFKIYPKDQRHYILEIKNNTMHMVEVEGTSIGVFAWALDKNDVPIFTGDIIRGINDKLYVVVARIVENPSVGSPMITFFLSSLENPEEKEHPFTRILNRDEGYVVVGNVYNDKDEYKSCLEYCDIIDYCDLR